MVSQKNFQKALELSPDGFGILKPLYEKGKLTDFVWEYANPAAGRLLKAQGSDLVKRSLRGSLPSVDSSGLLADFIWTFETGGHFDAEVAFRRGELSGWFRITALKLEDEMAFFLRDITERKLWEESLRQSETRFRVIAQSNMIGLLFWDEEGKILDINEAFAKMIGASRENFLSSKMTLDRLTPAGYRDLDGKAMAQMRAEGSCRPFEKEIFHQDGHPIPVLWGAARLEAINYEGVAFVVDMTEKREMEKQREIFLGHELKTPLASIKGFAQLLTGRLKKDGDEKTLLYLSRISGKVDDLTQLIADLTDFTRLRSGRLELREEVFDFDELVREAVADCQSISPGHRIFCRGETGKFIQADRGRVSQVLANLLSNAVKYSPGADKVLVHLSAGKDRLTIAVQDFGFGIPEEDQEKIFQPFFRSALSKNEVPGVGLGLYISRQILKPYQGRLRVESRAGEGATFFLSLPLKRSSSQS